MSRYDPLRALFASPSVDYQRLSLADVEAALGRPLPPSARQYAAWWYGHRHCVWEALGWRASPHLAEGIVEFRRVGAPRHRDAPREGPAPSSAAARPGADLILLGCVKTKRATPAAAKDLYVSPLWHRRRAYAEHAGKPWYILSAEYGLLSPEDVVAPYDRYLKNLPPEQVDEWARRVTPQILEVAERHGAKTVEVHAGAEYSPPSMKAELERAGLHLVRPLDGLRFGEQLAWYDAHSGSPRAEIFRRPPAPGVGAVVHSAAFRRTSPFRFRWPDGTEETYDPCWEAAVLHQGKAVHVRHGLGRRHAFGRERVRSVTWVDGHPMVEEVEADDYRHTRALISVLRRPGSQEHVTSLEEVAAGYAHHRVVVFRSEIRAEHSPHSLALKIREDDLRAWLTHALLRADQRLGQVSNQTSDP